jgi:hypothetical protein
MSAAELRTRTEPGESARLSRGRIAGRVRLAGASRNPARSFGVIPEQFGTTSGRELRDEKPE